MKYVIELTEEALTEYKRSRSNFMKNIDISQSNLTITDLLELAEQDAIILKKSDGTEFILSVIDDFAEEVKALASNQQFMNFLAHRSQSIPKLSLEEARKRLDIN